LFLTLFFLLVVSISSEQAPSWPIAYSYAPDNMPIIQVRLAPPNKQMPTAADALSKLEQERVHFETEQLLQVEAAYKASLEAASTKLTAVVDRCMHAFENPPASMALKHHGWQQSKSLQATSFHESSKRSASNAQGTNELAARLTVLASTNQWNADVEQVVKDMENKRSREEGHIFQQAMQEMEGLTTIVANEAEAELMRHVQALASRPAFVTRVRSTAFLNSLQPVPAGGPQLTTNVRIMASEEPFQTVGSMVESLAKARDASEGLIAAKILELEIQLLQAENEILSTRLNSAIERVVGGLHA